MAERNVRFMEDENGAKYYPVCHVDYIEGLDPEQLGDAYEGGGEDDNDAISALKARVYSLETKAYNLETRVYNLEQQIAYILANM